MALGRTNINLPEIPIKPKAVYLYKKCDECTEISGGWSTKYANSALSPSGSGWSGNPTRTKESDHLLISIPDQTAGSSADRNMVGIWFTNNKVNLTDFDKLVFDIEASFGNSLYSGSYQAMVAPLVTTDKYSSGSYQAAAHAIFSNQDDLSNKGKRRLIEIDVSGISGEYYIMLRTHREIGATNSGDDSVVSKIYNVYLQ